MSYQNSIGWKQNNYGNLRGAGVNWKGKTGMAKGFSVFDTPVNGVRAIFVDLSQKLKAGKDDITKIMYMYAPPSDGNNTPAYIKFIAEKTGIHPTKKVGQGDLKGIVKAIIMKEIGYNAPQQLIDDGYNSAFGGSISQTVQTAVKTVKDQSDKIIPIMGTILLLGSLYYVFK